MHKMTRCLLSIFILLTQLSALHAAQIDTVQIYSEAMDKNIPAIVITPEGYATSDESYPTIYLLHGYSDSYSGWTTKASVVPALADQHQVIVVMPDGGYNSWYLDSPIDPKSQYETHVSAEVVQYVDSAFRTIPEAEGRAITGLSMGGHGGLFLGIRHQDTFGAAGSMSGGVDLTYNIHGWEIAEKLGPYSQHPACWDSLSVVNLVEQIEPDQLKIIVDCGVDDFFFEINRHLHRKLLEENIPHDYIERPGSHNWAYWDNAVQYQFLFFSNFFKSQQSG
ncbi:alpha/beta hydrolase [Catalinimonas niigatensis]|uniref:alpha/beta hydrolase n=1 Tax=Catalinimonas niigatensis TaxID=1397264 RepID=UPI002AA2AFBB|nr:alpha/beta hydrolase family protein [Catalinimonas niigatensis]WPP51564.1 alpha/beta hydrolase family protein [Catalinimonas niigatensis]